MNDPKDFQGLQPLEVMQVGNSFLNVIFSTTNLERSWNNLWRNEPTNSWAELQTYDYIAQTSRVKDRNTKLVPIKGAINTDEFRFLIKLRDLCRQKKVQMIYAHGPIWELIHKSSQPYIHQMNQTIASYGVTVVPKIVEIADKDMGDSWDHVDFTAKSAYTKKYFELLKFYLKH